MCRAATKMNEWKVYNSNQWADEQGVYAPVWKGAGAKGVYCKTDVSM